MANGTPKVRKMSRSKKLKRSEQPKVLETIAGSFYRHVDPRLKQQLMDSKMIREDHDSIANLSPRFISKIFNPDRFKESLGYLDEKSEVGE